jgi:hypothetical protein
VSQASRRRFLLSVLIVVGMNYLAQIPYYLDVYYLPHGAAPNLRGSLLLGATLVWFVVGWALLARGMRAGYWVLLSFLAVETGFYVHNVLVRVVNGYPPFMDLPARDGVLDAVFGIGYVNMLCGLYFVYYLLRHYRALSAGRPGTAMAQSAG